MDEGKKEHEHHENHESHESHEHVNHVEHHQKTATEKIRQNPWILSSIVLGILAIVLLISMFSSGGISASDAGNKLIDFYTSMGVQNLTLLSVQETSGIYAVNISYKGQVVPLYITKDGKEIIQGITPTETSSSSNSNTPQANVPKSDKPTVELYVFAYCPYGLQMEKAIIPAIKLFGSDINFSIRQIGAMHGDFEKLEAQRQLCINKYYPTKYLDYVSAFASSSQIGACSGDATCLTPLLGSVYSSLGIDASKINSCIPTDGLTMYNKEVDNANAMGISGSPTLVINGVQASSDRSSEAAKGVICNSFSTVPSECSTTLSSTATSPGFGSSSSSSSSSASCS